MKEIINEVQRVFTDEELKILTEEYMACNAEFSEFFKKVYDSEISIGNEVAELSLDMIPKVITKYILDNVIEFIEYCNKREVRIINDVRKIFAKEVEFATMKLEKIPGGNAERKKYENYKYSYEQNINLWQIGYGIHISTVKELIEPLKQFMEDNLQRALPEMITNYKIVCQVHGISEQEIENMQNAKEDTEKTLEELEQELQKLQKQEKRTTQQRDASKLLKNAYEAELNKKDEDV